MKARPNSPLSPASTVAAQLVRHHLLAVADTEDWQAGLKDQHPARAGCLLQARQRVIPRG